MTASEPTMNTALLRGTMCKCPACGEGQLFRKFLKVSDTCNACGEELRHHRADDMPAYIVMSIDPSKLRRAASAGLNEALRARGEIRRNSEPETKIS